MQIQFDLNVTVLQKVTVSISQQFFFQFEIYSLYEKHTELYNLN